MIYRFAALWCLFLSTLTPYLTYADDGGGFPIRPKLALLIGNWDYDENGTYTDNEKVPQNRLRDLKNPCNDIELIRTKLIILGWDKRNIISRCNAEKTDILGAIEEFTQLYMIGFEPFGFIYYAGHGVQIETETYIFGVDANINPKSVATILKSHSYRANLFKGGLRIREEVLSNIGDPGKGSVLIVLDACRENPLFDYLNKEAGLAISAPRKTNLSTLGIKIFYSTANGQLASDSGPQNGRYADNSPFARIFAREMAKQPTINHVIRTVTNKVYDATKSTGLPQVPDQEGELNGPPPELCFKQCENR